MSFAASARSSANKIAQVLGATLGVLLLCLPLFSQGSQGAIQGSVFDQSGGVLAGATVTVTDVARGVTRNLTADSAGAYNATSLTPGIYNVRAEAKGFQNVEHSNVQVEVGQTIRVDLTLTPGAQTQTITVTSEAPSINTTDATLGGTVSNAEILALPLNGRNFERLLQLRPGVVTSPGSGAGDASTNGRRTGNDLLLVEGIPLIGPSNGTTTLNSVYRTGDANSLLPIDAIQEFNTQQNPKAEYGWRDGSVVDVGVKSGTNSLHGAAYAFGRDAQAFDAGNPFPAAGDTKPSVAPATVEQFGVVGGGRIIKDKLFWFMGYEGLRTTLTNPFVDTIPVDVSLANVLGNGPAGDTTNSMIDACNGLASNGEGYNPVGTPGGVTALSAQLAGITINPNTGCKVTAGSPAFENLFPFNNTQSVNYSPNLVTTGPLNNGFIKGDYVVSQHHHISGFYFVSKAYQQVQYSTSQLTPMWEGVVPSSVQQWTGNWAWTPNSTWVNEFRSGYGYLHASTASADGNLFPVNPWPNGYGFNSGITPSQKLYGGLPNIVFSGDFNSYLGAGKRTGVRGPEGNFSIIDDVSYLRGKHAFKFGFNFIDIIYDNNAYNYANGQVKFKHLQDFLDGNPRSGNLLVGDPNVVARAHWFGLFAQDDFRVSTRVTLNLGLRWEYEAPPVEHNNYEGTFVPTVNPLKTFAVQQAGPGTSVPNIYNPDWVDFSPRAGLAWDVKGNGKTVVRAGFSLMRNPEIVGEYIGFAPFGANVPSLGINTSGTAVNAHTAEALPLQGPNFNWTIAGPVFPTGGVVNVTSNGVTANYSGVTCLTPSDTVNGNGVVPPPCSTQAVNPNFKQPYSLQWNLDIQRAITNNLTFEIAYVGVHGGNEAAWTDINQPAIGVGWTTPTSTLPASLAGNALPGGVSPAAWCLASAGDSTPYDQCGIVGSKKQNGVATNALGAIETANAPFFSKFPYLSNIVQLGNNDFSNYHAMQITVNERPWHGLAFLVGYTFSHALDVVSADSTSQQLLPIDSHNVRGTYGSSDFDVRNRFTFSPTYAIPGRKSPGQMLQGWTVSGILLLEGGQPWFPVDGTNDLLGTGEINNSIDAGMQTWNYTGPASAFTSNQNSIPLLTGSAATTACLTAATAPYANGSQLQQLAVAALNSMGCYVRGGGILTPPAFGTIGDASRNMFRGSPYYNVDMSIGKEWKFKERYSAQFRAEFFNLFNRADFGLPGASGLDPSANSQFSCSCATPDVQGNNPVLGSGGPRHIQFGLKLLF
jgi:hypothetical protein